MQRRPPCRRSARAARGSMPTAAFCLGAGLFAPAAAGARGASIQALFMSGDCINYERLRRCRQRVSGHSPERPSETLIGGPCMYRVTLQTRPSESVELRVPNQDLGRVLALVTRLQLLNPSFEVSYTPL